MVEFHLESRQVPKPFWECAMGHDGHNIDVSNLHPQTNGKTEIVNQILVHLHEGSQVLQ